MKSDCMHNTLSEVAQLQDQLFPVKGNGLSQQSDACKDEKPEEGYRCHRLQPPPLAESSSLSLLYSVVKEACAQQNVKWPVECQVIPDVIQHLEDWPLYPEAFYQPSGRELRPQPVGDETGRIVYQYYPTSAVNYFTRSCVGGNKQLSHDVRPPRMGEEDTALQFESRFESGNLAKCVQISECYYELHIRADLYTARHMQWFYFSVSNTRKDITYRFSIVNLSKGDSLYNHGLRPLMYSVKESTLHNVGWRRCGSNIIYFRNQDCDGGCFDSDDEGEEMAPSYTLTFNIIFPHDFDTVFLSHCFPYTYSMLQQHLLCIQNDPYRSLVCRQRVLCRSLAGNPVYILTITGQEPEDEHKKKRAVVLTARVHPGETPSSWIMKGALDFLTSDNPKAVELRRQFVFKVIPMVNPDGVIVGNHRCSLAGRDLNRQYKMVVKEMFPAVWHTKAMVRRLMDELGVMMFCDFHAHSRKHNIFLYGCENRRNNENHLREQIFPLLLHYNAEDKFSFRNCKFRVQRCKEGTARVVAWMMGILHSYTLESSFGGASEGPRAGTHYSILDFLTMGRQFCESLGEYFDTQPGKEKLRNRLWSRLVKKGSNADEPTTVDLSESSSSEDSDRAPLPRVRRKRLARNQKRRGVRLGDKMQTRAEKNGAKETLRVFMSLEQNNEQHEQSEYFTFKETNSSSINPLNPAPKSPITFHHPTMPSRNHLQSKHPAREKSISPCWKCSMDSNEETSSYVERVGELISTRLAVSDNEGDSSVSYWELRSPTRQWEQGNFSGVGLNRHDSHRSFSLHSGRLKDLSPFIAKTRLHEPRVASRSPRSPTLHHSTNGGRTTSHSFKIRSDSEKGTPILKKKKNLRKSFSERDDSDVCVKGKASKSCVRGFESEQNFKEEKTRDGSLRGVIPPPINQTAKDTSGDLFYLRPEVEFTIYEKSIMAPYNKEESKSGILTESKPLKIEDDPLCADIVACDTLFLDIGTKETPQLKAARNLKGRLKKKKKKDLFYSELSESKHTDGGKGQMADDFNENEFSKQTLETSQTHNEPKPKKKIKIVIGKRPKPKSRKKILADIID